MQEQVNKRRSTVSCHDPNIAHFCCKLRILIKLISEDNQFSQSDILRSTIYHPAPSHKQDTCIFYSFHETKLYLFCLFIVIKTKLFLSLLLENGRHIGSMLRLYIPNLFVHLENDLTTNFIELHNSCNPHEQIIFASKGLRSSPLL